MTQVSYALRGLDEDAPTQGSDEYTYWLSILNRKKEELYSDPKNWSDIYETRSVDVIVAATVPSYDLDTDFIYAERFYIVDTDGNRHYVDLIKPEERKDTVRQVFIGGTAPAKLYFTSEIVATETIVGGTLYCEGYFMPADVDSDVDTIPVHNGAWAVMSVAAEVAFNDLTYEDKSADLNAKANYLYSLMTRKNRKGTRGNARKTPYDIKRIGMNER